MLRSASRGGLELRESRSPGLDEGGFTLVEMLAAIAILALMVGPLTLSLLVTLKATDIVGDSLSASNSRQQLAAVFVPDVASLDASGVSYDVDAACAISAKANLLVNLNSTRINFDTSPPRPRLRRVSYWSSRTESQLTVSRTSCSGEDSASLRSDGPPNDVVEIPIDPNASKVAVIGFADRRPGAVCNEASCALSIAGRFGFEVSAQRRLFGAGVPLEIEQVYSSSQDRFSLPAADGSTTGLEREWPGALSLARGLPGPGSVKVQFRLQQLSSGNFFNPSADNVFFKNFADVPANPKAPNPSSFWFDGTWQGGSNQLFWSLPLTLDQLTRAGQYNVWSRVVDGSGAIKTYGGTSGFAFWLDWKPDDVVWVSNQAAGPVVGLDDASRDGTATSEAVASLNVGLLRSIQANRPQILVVGPGPYGPLTVGPDSSDNRVITGGIDPISFKRVAPVIPSTPDPTPSPVGEVPLSLAGTSTVVGDSLSTNTAVVVEERRNITLRHLLLDSGSPGSEHRSSYGLRAIEGAGVRVEASFVRARVALAGTDGGETANGEPGCFGSTGGLSTETNNSWEPAPSSSGETSCEPEADSERHGGGGGGGGAGGVAATDGLVGEAGGEAQAGGAGGTNGCAPGVGPGSAGAGTSKLQPAEGAKPGQSLVSSAWSAGDGETGAAGLAGRGGSGGGGSGGDSCAGPTEGGGQQGASAGQGGQGGRGGVGGLGGGGSFGIYVNGTSSLVRVDAKSRVEASDAGKGGDGADGGVGGPGGKGGTLTNLSGAASGGPGGGGGGGGGGAAGAGGNGGWSVAVFADSVRGVEIAEGATLIAADFGAAGLAGAVPDNPGQPSDGVGPGFSGHPGSGAPGGRNGLSIDFYGWDEFDDISSANGNGSAGPTAGASQPGAIGGSCRYWLSVDKKECAS